MQMRIDNNLRLALDKVFIQLQENLMLPLAADKTTLIDDVMENILNVNNGALPALNLQDETIYKTLCVSLIASFLKQQDEQFEFDFKLLFKPIADTNRDDIKLQLKPALEKLLLKLNNRLPTPHPKQKIQDVAEKLADIMVRRDNKCLGENAASMRFIMTAYILSIADPKEASLRSLFGGLNPKEAGGVTSIVEFIAGNIADFMNIALGFDDSLSFMDKQNRFENIDPGILADKISAAIIPKDIAGISIAPRAAPGG